MKKNSVKADTENWWCTAQGFLCTFCCLSRIFLIDVFCWCYYCIYSLQWGADYVDVTIKHLKYVSIALVLITIGLSSLPIFIIGYKLSYNTWWISQNTELRMICLYFELYSSFCFCVGLVVK